MKRLASVMLVLFLMLSILMVWKPDVPSVNAASSIYQGNLILTGNNVTTIEGRFDINGSIRVQGNATLILKNTVVNFTQKNDFEYFMTFENPANGNPRLFCDNSTITASSPHPYFRVMFFANSSGTISKSTITGHLLARQTVNFSVTNSSIYNCEIADSAVVSIQNSSISGEFAQSDSATVTVTNSTINYLIIHANSVNCSLVDIRSGLFKFWDFKNNSSMIIGSGGNSPNVSLGNTTVNKWEFELYSKSNATITNSTLYALEGPYGSIFWITNSNVDVFNLYDHGIVYTSWFLYVHVTDSTGQNVPSASVTATFPNSTVAQVKQTNATGWARLTLTEKMTNETGNYPIGNYTVKAEYGTYSSSISANMTGTKEAIIQLPLLVIPEFPTSHALLIMATLTLVGALFYRKKHFSQKKL